MRLRRIDGDPGPSTGLPWTKTNPIPGRSCSGRSVRLCGEFIDLFPFRKIKGLCPVAALKKQSLGKGGLEDPVLTYPSGNFVTTEAFNKVLRILLKDVVDFKEDTISCHSFKA